MDNNAETGTLNTLITTLIDSVNGYEDAASNSENSQFQQIFRERATERQQVAQDLRSQVRSLGGEPSDDGSLMGKTHQRWLDLKAAVTGRDEKSIINSVEAGEDYLKEKFEAAIRHKDLPAEARAAVEEAWTSVKAGHDEMSALKHAID